jgi:NADH:ubiquinone reductase (H+-translocating)
MTPKHVMIAGGGFGGYYAAKALERTLPADVRITLVSDVNYMLYTPLLPGAAAGSLEPRHVVVPLRERLRRVDLRLGRVTGGDPVRRELEATLLTGSSIRWRYDHLIIALGSVSRTAPIPGLVEHAIGFKTLAEAIALRNRLVRQLESAEALDDVELRREHLTFLFVGAGYAGLEGLAELQDYAIDALRFYYPRCREAGMRWVLVDAASRIMQEMKPELAEFTAQLLRERGVEIKLGTQVEEVTDRSVTLSTGETIPCRTVCWTAGVKANPVAERLGLPLTAGRISCTEHLRVTGYDDIWALGDIAAVPDPARPGYPCPPTAQHAIRQARLMGENVAAALAGDGQLKPFRFKTLGAFAELGRQQGVASIKGIRMRGFPAWVIGRFYHLAWMPGVRRKARLVADWTVDFWFHRDTAGLGQLGRSPPLAD